MAICCYGAQLQPRPLSSSSTTKPNNKPYINGNTQQQHKPHKQWDMDKLVRSLTAKQQQHKPFEEDTTEYRLIAEHRAVPASIWHGLVRQLCNKRDYKAAISIVRWLQRNLLCHSCDILYSIMIHSLAKEGMLYDSFLVAYDIRNQGHSWNARVYSALIGASARNYEHEKALNLMLTMKSEGLQSDVVNYSAVLRALAKAGVDSSIVHRLYSNMKEDGVDMDKKLYNDLIQAFSRGKDVNQGVVLLGEMQARGFVPSHGSFAHVIYALLEAKRMDEAEGMLEEMRHCGIKPATRVYNALIKQFINLGLLEKAEGTVLDMEKDGVNPDRVTYSLLIEAYTSGDMKESARNMMDELKEKDEDGLPFVFARVLCGFRDRGEWQKVFVVLKQMRAARVSSNVNVYNVAIDTFGKFDHLKHAVGAFEEMGEEGIEPTEMTWSVLINSHCRAGEHDRAVELFGIMQRQGFRPSSYTYNTVLKCLGEQCKWDEMSLLVRKMRADGVIPNMVTYSTLVNAYGKAGRFSDVLDTMESMRDAGLKPSSDVYCALVNCYAQQGMCEQAVEAYRTMLSEGFEPSLLIFNSLMNAFSVAGRHKDAFSVFDSMKKRNVEPDVITYTTLMKALIKSKKSNQVPSVYKEMCLSGCKPDRKAKDMLLSALNYIRRSRKRHISNRQVDTIGISEKQFEKRT